MAYGLHKLTGTKFNKKSVHLWAIVGLAVLLTTLLFVLQATDTQSVHRISYLVFDSYQKLKPRTYKPAPVKIVDIDEKSLKELGQWPWPRTRLAELVNKLNQAGASAIAFDIVFAEPDRTSPNRLIDILETNPSADRRYPELQNFAEHDEIFASVIAQAPVVNGVILSAADNGARPAQKAGFAFAGEPPLQHLPAYKGAITSLPAIEHAAPGNGMISILGDNDRIVRRVQTLSRIDNQIVPSLALEALRVSQGARSILVKTTTASGQVDHRGSNAISRMKVGRFEIPTNERGEVWAYFRKPEPRLTISALDVLDPANPATRLTDWFDGNIVFVGTGAAGLRDIVATPLRPYEIGVNVHANFVEQVYNGDFLQRPDWSFGFERILLVVAAVMVTASVLLTSAIWSGLLALGLILGQIAYSWHAFSTQQFLVDPVFPALTVVALYSVLTAVRFFQTERERSQVRRAFGQYLSPVLVNRIADDPRILRLGGEERYVTVLFCDIRNFSSISENLQPEELTSLLNGFLTPMTDILLAEGATIDKYIGDSIMAFWNAPLEIDSHEQKALNAALAMKDRLKEISQGRNDSIHELPRLQIGIGINSGPCCVGNLGSESRFSYSAIGDTVNLASRLEGLTKQLGVSLILGEETALNCSEGDILELDLIRVVGRSRPERVFTAIPAGLRLLPEQAERFRTAHYDMLKSYREREWNRALDFISQLTHDDYLDTDLKNYYEVMAARIDAFKSNPPPADWDGIHESGHK